MKRVLRFAVVVASLCAAGLFAAEAMALTIASSAFGNGGTIPAQYTCDGNDRSPPLSWSGVPAAAKSLVLIVDDPDAPDPAAPKVTWVHWVLYNLPADATGLAANVTSAALPAGSREGLNDWHRPGYGGPCPPVGQHRYFFKLYALDVELANLGQASKSQLEKAMRGHVVDQAVLLGTYRRAR
jgi:Raf kinase inhibitor-like YbhB/YbcL family protein